MAGDKQRPGEWGVYDTNAYTIVDGGGYQPRVHDVRPGVRYSLHFDKPCWMPESDARVFLKDPAFRVVDENEDDIAPLTANALARALPTELPPNQVIADLRELTTDSLLTRAAMLRGGNKMSSATAREDLIAFLQDGFDSAGVEGGGAQAQIAAAAPAGPIDFEDMGDDELADLHPAPTAPPPRRTHARKEAANQTGHTPTEE